MSRPVTPAMDLRLLLPCLTAWALGAWGLAWSGTTRAGVTLVVLVLVTLLVACGVRPPGRHARASWRRDAPGVLTLTLLAAGLVLGASAAHESTRRVGPVADLARERAVVTAEGVVLTEPLARAGPPGRYDTGDADERDTPPTQVTLRVRLETVTARGLTSRVNAPVFIRADQAWTGVGWHDRITFSGRLSALDPVDPEVAALSPRGPPHRVGRRSLVRSAAEHLRTGLREAVAPLPGDARALLPALVIGDTSMTPPELTDDLLVTGMSHLSAVSGSNVAIVLAAIVLACRGGGVPRRWRPWLAGAGLAFFVVLARPEPSVLRAATMGAIGLLGLSTSRRGTGTPALCAAVLILLAIDPWLARSYGFVLSTLATLGLLLLVRPWSAAINARLPPRLHFIGPAVAIPLAAQLVCGPVIVLLQGNVSLIAVAANLVAAPFVAPATVLGVCTALAAVLSGTLATLVGWLGAPFAMAIAWTARISADVPGGTLPWPDGAPGALLLAALTCVGVLMGPWAIRRSRASPVLALCLGVVLAAGAVPSATFTWPPAGWRVVACDVGQGDGLVLASGPGRAVLVDVGPADGGMDACLRRLGVRTLDAVVLTHFHEDHVGGLAAALHGRSVGQLLVTPVPEPRWAAREVADLAERLEIPVRVLVAGDRLRIGAVRASVWWPARPVAGGSSANNASIVLHVAVGGVRALLLGDVEQEASHALGLALDRDPGMAAAMGDLDLVKMAHHGSSNVDEAFMDDLAGSVAIVSVGADNTYGHPTRTALGWAGRHGWRLLRTDRDGDIAVLDGPRVLTSE